MSSSAVPFSKRHLVQPRWKRDIPKGTEWVTNIVKYGNKEYAGIRGGGNKFESTAEEEELEEVLHQKNEISEVYQVQTPKEKRKTLVEMFFASFCLATDGYITSCTNTINGGLQATYGPQYTNSIAIQNISAIGTAGMIVSMLFFGVMSDWIGRKKVTLAGNAIMIIFSLLLAGAFTKGTQTKPTADRYYLDTATGKHYPVAPASLWSYITFLRFMVGIGIGSEYPGAASWATDISKKLPPKSRNMWIILFTCSAIDVGFFVGALVVFIITCIVGEDRYIYVWRWATGFGALFSSFFFFGRLGVKESESFEKNRVKKGKIPYWKALKFYWYRIIIFSIPWFCFDLSAYGFGGTSSLIIELILGDNAKQKQVWAYNMMFQAFQIVGSVAGSDIASRFGIRYSCATASLIQGAIGLVLYFCLEDLKKNVAAFAACFSLYQAIGNIGFGNNTLLFSSAGFATPVRGGMFSICSAIGIVGGLAAGYIFPKLVVTGGTRSTFLLGAILCIAAAFVVLFAPPLDQVTQQLEDKRFMEYLEAEGYDISQLTAFDYQNDVKEEVVEDESASEIEKKDIKVQLSEPTL
ncbi:hypothetical protein QEN19_000940 [Hanseniaspora menglaensis]